MSQIKNQIGPAVIQALTLCIFRFFTIPWRIWKGAAYRLVTMRQHAGSEEDKSTNTEFPIFDWFRAAWDGIIFLSWFVGALIAAILLIVGTYNAGLFDALIGVLVILLSSYFAVIPMSFFKESLILLLSIALNVERLAMDKSNINQQ